MKTCQAWVALMLATLVGGLAVGGSALAQQEYFVADSAAGEVFMLRDLNGDGDALDVGENLLWADGLVLVTDLRSYQSSILAISEGTDEIVRLTDLNGDGDALDVGESTLWADGFVDPVGLSVGGGDVVYATDFAAGEVLRLEDLNGDGDALDVGEQTTYASGPVSPTGVWARQGDLLVADYIAGGVRRLIDLNGDGDALDIGENVSQAPPASIGLPKGIVLGQGGEYFVSSELSDTVYRVEDLNGDGDALDFAEVLPYANTVFGQIDLPWHMTRYAAGGFLVSENDDDEVTRMRDINGDGDALDVGEVVPFATVTDPSALIAGVGPGAVGTMITIQDGPGTLDAATPNFVAIVEQSTVDRAAINAALDNGINVLVSSDNPASFAPGRIVQDANAPIDKTAGGDATLAIRADDSIELGGGITSALGALDVELVANDAAQSVHDLDPAAGDVLVAGSIDTLGGDLTTSGVNFDNTGGPITAEGVAMNHTGAITIAALLDANTMNVTAGGGTTITSTGRLVGEGSITGSLNNAGEFAPGSTPGVVNILGAYTQDPATGVLEIELAGSGGVPGTDFDQLVVTGNVMLDGMLDVSLINPFVLSPGQLFEIIDVGGLLSGAFSGLAEGGLVGNFAGTNVLITYLGGDGNDVTLLAVLPGDFDIDGDVDGFDFLKWQRGESPNPLSQSDLADWEANYGTVIPLAAISTAVPEPATGLLLMLGLMALHFRRDTVVS